MRTIIYILTVTFTLVLFSCDNKSFRNSPREFKPLEEFIGVRTSEGKIPGLYLLEETGVSTLPIVNKASDFLNSLDTEQRWKSIFHFNDNEWRTWSNVDSKLFRRQGVSLKEMNKGQKNAAFELLKTSLSEEGLQTVRSIMKTERTLNEIFMDEGAHLNEELYYFTFMGQPSENEPWGWQIDGHHLAINYFVLNGQVVMSPVFMGGEPAVAKFGRYTGNAVLQEEENLGLAFVRSLSQDNQDKATLFNLFDDWRLEAGAGKDNKVLDYEGVKASDMDYWEKERFTLLISQYVNKLRPEHAEIRMREVLEHLDDTWFAWIGEKWDDPVFYYRIHSPVILIEFSHEGQGPRPKRMKRNSDPSREHIHTIMRTPNGGDYGKDLLREHLQKHHSN